MLLITMMVLLSGNANAQGLPAVCAVDRDLAQERVELDFTPDYFFKPIPRQGPQDNRNEVSIIGPSGNLVLDMNTGDYRAVPGPYDAVPTPDGQIIITPGLNFYDRDNLSTNSTPLLADGNRPAGLQGVYHSAGVLPGVQTPNRNYRVITDTLTTGDTSMNTLMFKDFRSTVAGGSPNMGSNDQAPKPLCSNLGDAPYKLPMLSKDGQQLAAYDVEAGTTKIFRIVTAPNGGTRCEMTRDLGFATGKVEFSPDGKKITFASDTNDTNPGGVTWYEQPSLNSQNFQVYVVDLEEDTVQRISNQTRGNSYYPSFTHDNSVVFLEQMPDSTYNVVRAPIESAPAVRLATADSINSTSCANIDDDFVAAVALGSLWTEVCQGSQAPAKSLQGLAFTPLSLDGDQCRQLVQQRWPAYQQQLRASQQALPSITPDLQSARGEVLSAYYQRFVGLSQSALEAVCPEGAAGPGPGANVVTAKGVGEFAVQTNPLIMCLQCHATGGNQFDFANPENLSEEKDRIFSAVASEHMPLGVEMKPEERAAMLEYIRTAIPSP